MTGMLIHELVDIFSNLSCSNKCLRLETNEKARVSSLLQRLFCFTQTAIAAKHRTILYNRHRLAHRNYAAGHQKLLSLAGGSAVDVLLILQ